MSDQILCPRCGREGKSTKEISICGGALSVRVCDRCREYLTYNADALDRFELLYQKQGETTMPKKSNFTPEMDEYLILSVQNHAKSKHIAAKLGVPPSVVYDRISYLRKCGILPERGAADAETEGAETGKLNELESAMAEVIEEKTAEIQKLNDYATGLMDERDKLLKANYALREELGTAATTVEDLRNELRDTKAALEETELQFDAYRADQSGGAEILEKLIKKRTDLLAEAAEIETAIELIGKYCDGEREEQP